MAAELPLPQTPQHKLQLLQHLLTWLRVPVVLYTSGMEPETGMLAELDLPVREGWRICGFRATPGLSFERIQHDVLRWVRLQMRSQQMTESAETVEEGLTLLRGRGLQIVLVIDAAEVMLPGLPTMLWQWSDRLSEVRIIFVMPDSSVQSMQRTEPLLLKSAQLLAWPFHQPAVIMDTPPTAGWMPAPELMKVWPGPALYAVVVTAILALVAAVAVPLLKMAYPPLPSVAAVTPAAPPAAVPDTAVAEAPAPPATAPSKAPEAETRLPPASEPPLPPPATEAPVPVVPLREIQRQAAASAPAQPLSRVEVAAPAAPVPAAPLEIAAVNPQPQPELRPPAPPVIAPKPWQLPEALPGVRDAEWIEQQNPDSYALQWVTVADFASLREAVAAVPAIYHDLSSFHSRRDAQDKYPLLQGVYPDMAAASRAAETVPRDLGRPFPRQYRSLQLEISRLKAQNP